MFGVMPRPLRVQYEGAMYHVMSRGDRKGDIYGNDGDRLAFLELLARVCKRTGWQVHAYCLMSNHFHMVIETPQPNLVVGMTWFLGVYTQRYNHRHGVVGHVFSGRYKALLIDETEPSYLRTACDYVHLNPARAGLVSGDQMLESYVWSSYPEYLKPPRQRVEWMRTDRVLAEHGCGKDDAAARREFRVRMEAQRAEGLSAETMKRLREGWRFGAEDFLDRLMQKLELKAGETHGREQRRETNEQRAERIIAAELRKRRWREEELAQRPKGHPAKAAIARRIREETTMSLKWIAARLRMGGWRNVKHKLGAQHARMSL